MLQQHAEERRRGFYRLPSSHRAELIALLREQAAKGYWKELSVPEAEKSLGDWAGWLYFLVTQGEKRRGCLAPEAANELQQLPEVTYMCGVDGYVELCMKFYQAMQPQQQAQGHPIQLRGFREDYEEGFQQCRISHSDQRYFCAYAWDDDLGVRVFAPQRLLLGPRPGPHIFVRGSMAVSTVAAYLLAIPQLPHVDDLCGIETPGGMPSARAALLELFSLLQFKLGAAKAVPPRAVQTGASSMVALGPASISV